METVSIRKATLADLPKLQQLSAALIRSDAQYDRDLIEQWSLGVDGKKYLTKRIQGRKGVCLVAEIEGKIVGYATGGLLSIQKWRPVKRSELDNLYIDDACRSRGIGAKLVEAFIKWSKEKKMDRVMLYAEAQNDRGISFYKRNGLNPLHLVLEKTI
jgi:ribosomal protein S18 acetylase RimI-like enzyme